MARVTYGGGVTEFAGSIGGVTFLRNPSGPIAKLRSNPPVNPSLQQSGYQVQLATLVAYWSTLSQANKDTWDVIATTHDHTTPWGETKTLSGFQWFLSCNIHRLKRYSTYLDAAPAWYVPPPPPAFTIETSATYIRCAWSPNYVTIENLLGYVTLPLRQSSLKLRRSLFYVGYLHQVGSIATWDLTSVIESLFNVTWATFYASADCNIIIRLASSLLYKGYISTYVSNIVKVD